MKSFRTRSSDNTPFPLKPKKSKNVVNVLAKIQTNGKHVNRITSGDKNYSKPVSRKSVVSLIVNRKKTMKKIHGDVVYDNALDIKHDTIEFWGISKNKLVDHFKVKIISDNKFSMRTLPVPVK